ncbi:AN1-type zinc finger protein 6 isoform X1 [Hoplias malabaricus]|uniref:AN1-type zinc finger protein 6 isoform X1 n=1 Tax=Hoplias malabaricus TaxID=27720 RepID=UPI0034619DE3
MAQETNQTQAPLLCAMGCGFYGNPRTNSMCSVCYKDFLQRQNSSGRVSDSGTVSSSQHELQLDRERSVSECLSALEESLSTQSTAASSASALEQNSCQSIVKAAVEPPVEKAQDELKTEVAAGSAESVKDRARRGKRKLNEMLHPGGEDAPGSDASVLSPSGESEKSKPRRNRCFTCHKKVGLTGFDCRCGNIFCGTHRYSDVHSCTFDYKSEAAEKIRKENPVIAGEKIAKI